MRTLRKTTEKRREKLDMTWIEGYAAAAGIAMWKKSVENLCGATGAKKIGEQVINGIWSTVVKSNLVALPDLHFHRFP